MNITVEPKAAAQTAVEHANIKAVEFELALGTHDIRSDGFETCVERAAKSVGFTPLFNLPIPVDHDIQRLAALATIDDEAVVFVFVGLNRSGDRAIVQPDLSQLPHITQFAEAFFDLITD